MNAHSVLRPTILLLLLSATSLLAQTKPASQPPQLSPAAAYREATHPIEITHRNVANWSPIEQASLATAIAKAQVACNASKTSDYTGDTLMDLAQLCSLAMNWPAVLESTDHYIREKSDTPKTKLPDAYAGRVDAWLNLKNEPEALADAHKLLALTPYTALAAQASTQAIDYMRFLYPADALTLATQRSADILPILKDPTLLNPIAIPDLYQQALVVAELQQLQADPAAAAQTLTTLNAALPMNLTPDDTITLASLNMRYALLGHTLPPIPAQPAPKLPVANLTNVLLLFPDWCAQCLRLAAQTPQGIFSVEGHGALMFPLLVQTVPPQKIPPNTPPETFNPAYAAEALHAVPLILATPAAFDTFQASDFPLLILVDRNGLIRYIDVVDETALRPGNTIDSAISLLGKGSIPRPPAASQDRAR